ncbi:MAG: RNA polymerase subunit sigma-70 [Thalassobius sp.]|nr:RNA polymerase subunit sigma-70 [Thalassovita sp.]
MRIFDEHTVIEGCKKNEHSSQQKLYQRYADSMLGLCIRYLKDRDTAEEVMVAGFMKVFEKIDTFRGEGSFEGWLKRIMVNECLMYLRKNSKNNFSRDIEEVYGEIEPIKADTSLEAKELLEMVHQLPAGYRTVFNMYAIEGYNHQEIAKELNISEGTSKSQLSKARKFLQGLIKKYEKIS